MKDDNNNDILAGIMSAITVLAIIAVLSFSASAKSETLYKIMLIETKPDEVKGSVMSPVDDSFGSMGACYEAQKTFRVEEKVRVFLYNLSADPWSRIVENGSFCCAISGKRGAACNTVSKLVRENQ